LTHLRKAMQAFTLADLMALREQAGQLYAEFLRISAMSAGVYLLAAGSSDPQEPHTEDELYVVMQGHVHIRAGTSIRLSSLVRSSL
jgi:hypothetical protein